MATIAAPAVTATRPGLVRTGIVAAVAAGVATTAVVVAAHAAGVSMTDDTGAAFPLLAFPQLTAICTVLGLILAAVLRRRAATPARTFARTAWTLTAVSLAAPFLIPAGIATQLVLVATHLIAAAIVVPAITTRLR
jgi:hypothetical protein